MAKPDGNHSRDTGAMRDVANKNLPNIADDVDESRRALAKTDGAASAAFSSEAMSSALGLTSAPFTSLLEKWNQVSASVSTGMVTSQERIENAADALRATADDYDDVDTRTATEFEGLHQYRLLQGR